MRKASNPDRYLRRKQVLAMVGYSTATLYRMMSKGLFPKARNYNGSNMVFWLESEVQEWMLNQFGGLA